MTRFESLVLHCPNSKKLLIVCYFKPCDSCFLYIAGFRDHRVTLILQANSGEKLAVNDMVLCIDIYVLCELY